MRLFAGKAVLRISSDEFKDRALLKAAALDGCSVSLKAVYGRYRSAVCDFLRRSRANDQAEDICQAVFVQIYEGKCKYNGSSDVKSYLFGIAKNLLKQSIRQDKYKTHRRSGVQVDGDVLVEDNENCPVAAMELVESKQSLKEIVAQLPPKSAEAIKLVYLKEIPAQQAAESIGCDLKIFCDRLEYGLAALRKQKNLIA